MNEKTYQKIYHKKWYDKNKVERIKQIHNRRKSITDWFNNYRRTQECFKCDESHEATLDFHHREQHDKEVEVSVAIRNGWSIERIKKEMLKCDVLCSNCHRKEHFRLRSNASVAK